MAENKPNQSFSTLKVIVAIIIIVALWPILEVITGILASITTFAIGMGLAFILFIAIVYPYNFTNKSNEKWEPSDAEKNIRNNVVGAYNNIKEFLKNKGD